MPPRNKRRKRRSMKGPSKVESGEDVFILSDVNIMDNDYNGYMKGNYFSISGIHVLDSFLESEIR